jgi:hypothetical protein
VVQQGFRDFSVGGCDTATSLCSVLVLVGNLVDGMCTLMLLQLNLAREANPLMAWVYGMSPLSFMVTKLGIVQFGLLLLWMQRHLRAARLGLQFGAVVYAVIVAYHVAFALRLAA